MWLEFEQKLVTNLRSFLPLIFQEHTYTHFPRKKRDFFFFPLTFRFFPFQKQHPFLLLLLLKTSILFFFLSHFTFRSKIHIKNSTDAPISSIPFQLNIFFLCFLNYSLSSWCLLSVSYFLTSLPSPPLKYTSFSVLRINFKDATRNGIWHPQTTFTILHPNILFSFLRFYFLSSSLPSFILPLYLSLWPPLFLPLFFMCLGETCPFIRSDMKRTFCSVLVFVCLQEEIRSASVRWKRREERKDERTKTYLPPFREQDKKRRTGSGLSEWPLIRREITRMESRRREIEGERKTRRKGWGKWNKGDEVETMLDLLHSM